MPSSLQAPDIRTLALEAITIAGPYARESDSGHYTTIWAYRDLYADDAALLPPLDVFCVEGQYVLSDGFLRYHAARHAGLTTLPCRIFTGSLRDAYLHAIEVNGHQKGLPYTSGDYARIIRWCLADAELAALSHRALAKRLGCSHTHVDNIANAVQDEATVAAALATVATRAKTPQAKERQQLAGVLQVPVRAIPPDKVARYRARVVEEVGKGKTIEAAAKVVGTQVMRAAPPARPSPSAPAPQEELPPPSAAVVALGTRIAEGFLQPVRQALDAWAAPLAPAQVVATITAHLLADPAALVQTDWHDVRRALPLALEQVAARLAGVRKAIQAWQEALEAFEPDRSTVVAEDVEPDLADPAVLVGVFEHLTAQRYQHPPATARAIGAAMVSLEAYLEEHAPTSTPHPARREVEL
jgi:ParB-like chromosome segregation protein Spo0J